MVVDEDNTVIENVVIESKPGDDIALEILNTKNVLIRNVIIYHPANSMGIHAEGVENLVIENVQVIAYGNEWGANACPERAPFENFKCSNINLFACDDARMTNV